jgi:hypothetical protein
MEQFLKQVKKALSHNNKYKFASFEDIRTALGWGHQRTHNLIKDMVREGTMEIVSCLGEDVMGRTCRRMGYKITK